MGLDELLAVDGVKGIEQVVQGNTTGNGSDKKTPLFQQSMLNTIKEMDEYAWRRGEMGGLDWGFDGLNKALEGLNTGVHLVAGQSNIGKSAMCLQLAYNISMSNQHVTKEKPKKAFCLYFSLDDSANELLPRFIAIDQKIPINAIRFPKKYQDDVRFMEKREVGMDNLRMMTNHFGLMDVNAGSSIEFIEETSQKYALELAAIDENYQLVVFVDNFHDITVDSIKFGSDASAKYDYIADQLTKIATNLDTPMICTAEFRKLNGNKRPKIDDIRETTKIGYEAKAIFLCYNEVGLRGQSSSIYWQSPDTDEKMPIYEMHVGKNKFGSYKGRLFYEFVPSMSLFREVPQAGVLRYSQMIQS